MFAFGGFWTFLNRESIERMSSPIFCDDERQQESPYMDLVCSNLQQNRVGELELFRERDSVFNIFYKYAVLKMFCMHSDWAWVYMISLFSGGSLNQIGHQINPHQCHIDPCTPKLVGGPVLKLAKITFAPNAIFRVVSCLYILYDLTYSFLWKNSNHSLSYKVYRCFTVFFTSD